MSISLQGSLQNPAFSPDGKSIIFTRFVKGYNQEPAEIYKFNLETEVLTLMVSDGSGNVNLPGSTWVNGQIIFSSTREPHDEIYLISENGKPGDELKMTNRQDSVAYEPSFSPDGQWAVFESHKLDEEGNGIITINRLSCTCPYFNLTAKEDDCRQPNWSPRGDKILYQQKKNNVWNIWMMNIDGTDKVQVTNNLGSCTDASFSEDGQFIVFSTDFQSDIANIYKIGIDGNNPTRLTNFKGYDGAVSVFGNKLIFESSDGDPDGSDGTKLVVVEL